MNCEALYSQADQAGKAAVESMQVRPMVVSDPDTNQRWYVEDGVCGFAWIKIRPAKGEFVKWLKQNKIGRTDSFEGGYMIWVHAYNQSMEKKHAYAKAFAKVLEQNGLKAYAFSRMD